MMLDGTAPDAVGRAAALLAAGQLVAFPTETVYGLGADAGNDTAVQGIFAAKGRPADHPLIVHVADASQVSHFASAVPAVAQQLMQAFWPGPLTLILPRRPDRARAAAGGHATVGLRCPAHPVAQALLQACAVQVPAVHGLAGPSANRFGRVSPTTAAHVEEEFGASLAVLDGGPCRVGIESTIVDCSRAEPVLLRPGMLGRAEIERCLGRPLREPHQMAGPAVAAAGTLESHYAPQARVRLMDGPALETALQMLGAEAPSLGVYARRPLLAPSARVRVQRMPGTAEAAARELFAVLRGFDAQGVPLIWIETPPDTPDWEGVHDRLRRAAA